MKVWLGVMKPNSKSSKIPQSKSACRRNAQDCIDLANKTQNLNYRASLLTIAAEWLELSNLAEIQEERPEAVAHIVDPPEKTQ